MTTRQQILRRFKQIIRKTPVGHLVQIVRTQNAVRTWEKQGKPLPPPPAFKQAVVRKYGKRFHLRNLVETGTYQGEMVLAQNRHFKRIFSIELDAALFSQAQQQFAHLDHVTVLQGDSSQVLPTILNTLNGPCLFWLDAHYSGGITARGAKDTPILQELAIIFQRNNDNDVILIDDVHSFDGSNDYPSLAELERYLRRERPEGVFVVADNIIRFSIKPSRNKVSV